MAESGRQTRVQAAQAQGRRPTALQRAGDLLRRATLFGLIFVLSSASRGASDFYLKDGDTVVFYGDSITDPRVYTVFTETFAVTRFPKLHLRFVHSGWSGDTVSGG